MIENRSASKKTSTTTWIWYTKYRASRIAKTSPIPAYINRPRVPVFSTERPLRSPLAPAFIPVKALRKATKPPYRSPARVSGIFCLPEDGSQGRGLGVVREGGRLARTKAQKAEAEQEERLLFGGMARWWGVDFFGPNYASSAERRDDKIYVWIDPFNVWRPTATLARISEWPVVRSVFFWFRILLVLAGSIRALVFFVASMAIIWFLVSLAESATEFVSGPLGALLAFFAAFPILPVLLPFFAAMKFTPIGRYHGAEHKAVAAYEK